MLQDVTSPEHISIVTRTVDTGEDCIFLCCEDEDLREQENGEEGLYSLKKESIVCVMSNV